MMKFKKNFIETCLFFQRIFLIVFYKFEISVELDILLTDANPRIEVSPLVSCSSTVNNFKKEPDLRPMYC